MSSTYEKAQEASSFICKKIDKPIEIFIILGSGLGNFADSLDRVKSFDYSEIPHLKIPTVEGHNGKFLIGYYKEVHLCVLQGRLHYYEGYSLEETTFPVRIAKLIGINRLIVTNSAGGINTNFSTGDIMVINDHINLFHNNPLQGKNDERFGPRFPDLTNAYNSTYRQIAHEEATKLAMNLQNGIYAALTGPSFETPAEINLLRTLGIDAVGMSTVPEVIVARHMNMEVLGFSCISNLAAGTEGKPLNHEEVLENGFNISTKFTRLLQSIIPRIVSSN